MPPPHAGTDELAIMEILPRGGCILAETGRDPWDAPVRAAAFRLARSSGSDVVLFDRSAASWGGDPFPSGRYTAQVEGPHGERPLVAGELEALGRGYLRDQLLEAERMGLVAQAWLPRRRGVGGMVDAVDRIAPHLVLLHDERRRGWLGGLMGERHHEYAARMDIPIAAVERGGGFRVVSRGRDPELTRSRLMFMADLPLRPVRGSFRRFDVRIRLDPDGASSGTVEAVIEASSVQTGRAPRDLHLRSRGFLDAERSPRITFRSSSIAREADTLTVDGELTIRGRSRPAILRGTVHELTGWADGRRRVRVHASTEIHWREWGIGGIPFIGDRLAIALDVVGVEVRPGSGRFNVRSMADVARPRRYVRPRIVSEPAR